MNGDKNPADVPTGATADAARKLPPAPFAPPGPVAGPTIASDPSNIATGNGISASSTQPEVPAAPDQNREPMRVLNPALVPPPTQEQPTAEIGAPTAEPIASPESAPVPAPTPAPEPAIPHASPVEPSYDADGALEWIAPESRAHSRTSRQTIVLGAGVVLALGFIYLITRELSSVIIVAFAFAVLLTATLRKPTKTHYRVDASGIHIGRNHYSYDRFRSFSVDESHGDVTVLLMPLQRLMPMLSVRVDPDVHDQLIDMLSAQLPIEHHRADITEIVMRRLGL